MNVWLAFVLGVAAHVLAAILGRYSRWRFHHAADPDAEELGCIEDLRAFGQWLVQGMAGRFLGRHRGWSDEYDRRPEPDGNWS